MLKDPNINAQTYISGSMKWKYHQKAVIPIKFEDSKMTELDQTNNLVGKEENNTFEETISSEKGANLTKDVGVQTDMRDSETQTLPFTPKEYVLPGTNPEVLKIKHFKYGKELPPSLGKNSNQNK